MFYDIFQLTVRRLTAHDAMRPKWKYITYLNLVFTMCNVGMSVWHSTAMRNCDSAYVYEHAGMREMFLIVFFFVRKRETIFFLSFFYSTEEMNQPV